MQINQNIWRLLGIILFSILGSLLGFIILAAASRNMTLSEFGLLGIFTALLYVPGLIANIVQISGMSVLSPSLRSYQTATSLNHNRTRIVGHFLFSVLITCVVTLYLILNASDIKNTVGEGFALIILWFVIIFASLFQGRYLSSGRFTEFHAIGFLASIVRTFFTIVFLENGYGLISLLLVYAASTGLVGIFCAAKSRRFYWTSPRQITHKFIAQASILGLTAFCFQLDVVFSRAQISYNDTGVYFAGAQLAKFTCLLVLSASLAFLPTIMGNTAGESQEKATLMKGIRFSFSVSLVVSLILLLLGSKLINFLFGLDFSGSTSLIPYFILGSLTWSVLLTRINLDISKNNNRVILMLVLLILFHFTLVSMSSSMETIALSWSITGTVGLVLYTLLAHYNWFYSKTTL